MSNQNVHISPDDPYDLARFVQAQQENYEDAFSEIEDGLKRSHWMWYVFPQFNGLGASLISRRYSIKSVDEAKAFLDHKILGPRLLECCETLVKLEGRSATHVFGFPDDRKLQSCATLFAAVSPGAAFDRLLVKYFAGERDARTLELLGVSGPTLASRMGRR